MQTKNDAVFVRYVGKHDITGSLAIQKCAFTNEQHSKQQLAPSFMVEREPFWCVQPIPNVSKWDTMVRNCPCMPIQCLRHPPSLSKSFHDTIVVTEEVGIRSDKREGRNEEDC
jgi:hypothetical protein